MNPLGDAVANVVFVGNFAHPPNVDAALRLALHIFPHIQERHADPQLCLFLVGSDPPPSVQQLANDRIIVTGSVDDVRPYLEGASVVVAPLQLGGGMRVKVIEALAAGKAVVATPLAVAGLSVSDGIELLITDTDTAFAAAVVRLLDDACAREQLAMRARAWAVERLDWKISVAAYEELYAQLHPSDQRKAG